MEYRALGTTGLQVSVLGFGCGAIGGLMTKGDPAEQRQAVERALAAGVTYFDTAPSYGDGASETNLGRVMRELGTWSRVRVGTKVRLSVEHLQDAETATRASVEESLRRLGRENVDLLQFHTPVVAGTDGRGVPLDRTLEAVLPALQKMRSEGKASHIGFTGLGDTGAIKSVIASGTAETVQSYFNAVNPSAGYAGRTGGEQDFDGVIDRAAGAGMGVIAIRVMAAGVLTAERHANAGDPSFGLVNGYAREKDLARGGELAAIARRFDLDGAYELALRFALAKPGVSTAMVGLSSLGQLEDAIRWAERGPLPEAVVQAVLDLAGR